MTAIKSLIVGVASEMIEGIVGRRRGAAAAATNPTERRRLTTAGQTGRVSCNMCRGRRCERNEKRKWRHSNLWSSLY